MPAVGTAPRIPDAGTVLHRVYRERIVDVQILTVGFEYEGRRHGSLSAMARAATGTRWNGLLRGGDAGFSGIITSLQTRDGAAVCVEGRAGGLAGAGRLRRDRRHAAAAEAWFRSFQTAPSRSPKMETWQNIDSS
jgi:hypothetical protein